VISPTRHKLLSAIDAFVNLVLGAALLASPAGVLSWLGLPATETSFYASILGAVVFGIGAALVIELAGAAHGVRGLGLGGAIAINLCGGGVLLLWLLAVPLAIPLHGRVVLWTVGLVVVGLGLAELLAGSWKTD
jgi:hypothetical protein